MYKEDALTTPIKMAEYDNAIDDEPTAGSDNLVKSGGVHKEVKILGEKITDIDLTTYNIVKNIVTNDSSLTKSNMVISPTGPWGLSGYSLYLFDVQNFDFLSVKSEAPNISGGTLIVSFFGNVELTDYLGGITADQYLISIYNEEIFVKIPANAKYFVISAVTDTINTWAVNNITFDSREMIACWGDSITAGTNGSYPSFLQNILGNNYNVVNLGAGSAWMHDICERQGGVPALIKTDVSVPASGSFKMSNWGVYSTLRPKDILSQLAPEYNFDNSELAYNPVMIDGEWFSFDFELVNGVTDLTVTRLKAGIPFTIKEGTPIYPAAINKYRDCFNVFHMGTNDSSGISADISNPDTLQLFFNYHDGCIALLNSNNYIILGLFNISMKINAIESQSLESPTIQEVIEQYETYEFEMTKRYGLHFVPLRRILNDADYLNLAVSLGYMTQETRDTNATLDAAWIAKGCAAYSLMSYGSGDYVHPNSVGYKMIAYIVSKHFEQFSRKSDKIKGSLMSF